MVTGFRVLWRALVHFWDESLLLIRTNVVWFAVSLPLLVLTAFVCSLFFPPIEAESDMNYLPWIMAAFIVVVIPNPISVGVYAITNFVVNEETPEFSLFWRAIKLLWKKASLLYLIGAAVLGGLIFNTAFYMQVDTGILQAVAILWLYGILFWLSMQLYLLPMLVAAAIPPPPPLPIEDGWPLDEAGRQRPKREPPKAPEPEMLPLGTLYKRAAVLALANPLMSLVMLIGVFLALALSTFALPVYPLLLMSFVALIGCRGLRTLREKYYPAEAKGAAG
jgi:uncharacterized membrane protein YesL